MPVKDTTTSENNQETSSHLRLVQDVVARSTQTDLRSLESQKVQALICIVKALCESVTSPDSLAMALNRSRRYIDTLQISEEVKESIMNPFEVCSKLTLENNYIYRALHRSD